MQRKNIQKLALGGVLAALSVVLKLTLEMWITIPGFGFPFYGIPLILAGLYLGPLYGLIVSVVADTTFGIVQGYLPLYVLSSIAWGVIPSLFKRVIIKYKNPHINPKNLGYWVFVIMITYVVATLGNTLANYVHLGIEVMKATLYYRLALIPVLSPIIAFIVNVVYLRTVDHLSFLNKGETLKKEG